MFDEDLTPFFNDDEFAIEVTFGGNTFNVIYDHEYVSVNEIDSERPIFRCDSQYIDEDDDYDASITVNSIAYTIISIQPDGTGVTLVVLEEDD